MKTILRSMLVAPLLILAPLPLCADPPAGDPSPGDALPRPGEIAERLKCAGDPTQTYALQLPPGYTAERAWPLLVLMDPRGRALVPLQLFSKAAATYGFVLASSYDTLSDGPSEPNARSIAAMLPDLQRRLSVDTQRIYLAGFSGTARAAWDLAYRLKRHVAGLIGIGGGLPPGMEPQPGTSFVFFGGAGTTDFNYEEMRDLDDKLGRMGLAHRFRSFPGPHSWPPEPICEEAVEFLELRAMGPDLRARSLQTLGEMAERRLAGAKQAEASGDLIEALARYRDVVADFSPLGPAGQARQEAQRLERSKDLRRIADREEELRARRRAYERRFTGFLQALSSAPPPPLAQSLATLQIDKLLKEAAQTGDAMSALAAQRLLELVFVHTAFYEPRDYLSLSDPTRARALLQIAAAIEPKHPTLCMNLARVQAQLGEKAAALDALACAVDGGYGDRDALDADAYLAPLREEARYREILERLRARPPG